VGDRIEERVHTPRVEEVALRFDGTLTDLGSGSRAARRAGMIEVEDEALRGSPSEDELSERADDDVVAPRPEALGERGAREVADHRPVEHHRGAGEAAGVVAAHR